MGEIYAYVRVSSGSQNSDSQLAEIQSKYPSAEIIIEKASARRGNVRPEFDKLLARLESGDTLVAFKADRVARSVQDLLSIIERLERRGVGLRFTNDTMLELEPNGKLTPQQRLMVSMLGAVAEFELDLRRERQRVGIEQAKANGIYKGRKKAFSDAEVIEAYHVNKTLRKTAEALGCSPGTVHRRINAISAR